MNGDDVDVRVRVRLVVRVNLFKTDALSRRSLVSVGLYLVSRFVVCQFRADMMYHWGIPGGLIEDLDSNRLHDVRRLKEA